MKKGWEWIISKNYAHFKTNHTPLLPKNYVNCRIDVEIRNKLGVDCTSQVMMISEFNSAQFDLLLLLLIIAFVLLKEKGVPWMSRCGILWIWILAPFWWAEIINSQLAPFMGSKSEEINNVWVSLWKILG